MVEPTAPMCEQCKVSLIEIDTFGERLRGCVGCDQWQVVLSGEWAEVPEADIAALRGLGSGDGGMPRGVGFGRRPFSLVSSPRRGREMSKAQAVALAATLLASGLLG